MEGMENGQIAGSHTEASWINLIEAQFGVLKRFTLTHPDDLTHSARRRRAPTAFVRALRRYYTTVRLAASVHVEIVAHHLPRPARSPLRVGRW